MYAKFFVILSIIINFIMSTTQAAPHELCVTQHEKVNKDIHYPLVGEFPVNRLLLRDCSIYFNTENAVDDIRSFIVDRLDLPHLEWNILQATYTDKGLLFEMTSADDVQEILDKFYVKLHNKKQCVLKRTVKEFFTVEIR